MTGEAPTVAKCLLRNFGCSPNNEAIIGDLDERYGQGRCDSWYWRQALLTVVASFFVEIWNHKLLTLRAIGVGWVVFVGWESVFNLTRELLWRYERLTIALQVPEVVLFGVSAGWVVARLHHQSQRAMVLAYAACFAAVQMLWLVSASLTAPSGFYPFIYAVIFFNPLIYAEFFLVTTTVSILVGGVLTTQR